MENVTITQLLSFLGISGATCFGFIKLFFHLYLKEEIKKTITPNLQEIDNKIKEIEDNKVCKEFCILQHKTSEDRHNELLSAIQNIQNLLMNQRR
jgi:hypothetical protein